MPDGSLNQAEMKSLACKTTFCKYEPIEAKKHDCPFVLVVSRGTHTHPIPLPTKTPPLVRKEIWEILRALDEELPDLTARRFLCHASLKLYLKMRLPTVFAPTLSDLHVSLANRAHLQNYIDSVKKECFPYGTGWDGAAALN